MYVGPTTGKNMLGVLACSVGSSFSGIQCPDGPSVRNGRTKLILLVNVAFMVMSVWVLNMANSATARVCLVLGCVVIAAAHLEVSCSAAPLCSQC